MNSFVFRAYDIRGKYNEEINEDLAYQIGLSYGSYIQEKYQKSSCIVSFDNRLSSPSLATSLVKGITESGCNVINLGLTTTPMNYYGRYLYNMPGIMVTASHNPKDENGFKFSFDSMVNARGAMIEDFKNYTLAGSFKRGSGQVTMANIEEKYLEYLKYSLKFGKNKRKVVIDCGNGATTILARRVFSQVFCDFVIINEENDGTFPHHHPDPAIHDNLKELQAAVLENKADFGVSYDGDGDRIGIVAENGEIVPIEKYMALMIRAISKESSNKKFLYDIKCGKCVSDEINALGAVAIMSRTGASFTQYEVHQQNICFGGEYSGHIFFQDRDADVGSAFYASLRLLEYLSKTPDKLSELLKSVNSYYSCEEMKFPTISDEAKFAIVNKVKEFVIRENYSYIDIDGIKVNFTNGWALIRASNTGKNVTFRAEADTEDNLNMLKNIFIPLIELYNKTNL